MGFMMRSSLLILLMVSLCCAPVAWGAGDSPYIPYAEDSAYAGYSRMEEEHPRQPGSVTSGTGFFVSNKGYLITNEHVVRGCSDVTLRGTIPDTRATVVRTDAGSDLALLKADFVPRRVANIRDEQSPLIPGDPVILIGYPKEHGVSGVYLVTEATVTDLHGPLEEPKWIQFTNAAQQGNSGGPLLDAAGNVVGVVVGKTKMVMFNKQAGKTETLKESDIAISLPVLKSFLHQNQIYFRTSDSHGFLATNRVENQARDYVVNIHCGG